MVLNHLRHEFQDFFGQSNVDVLLIHSSYDLCYFVLRSFLVVEVLLIPTYQLSLHRLDTVEVPFCRFGRLLFYRCAFGTTTLVRSSNDPLCLFSDDDAKCLAKGVMNSFFTILWVDHWVYGWQVVICFQFVSAFVTDPIYNAVPWLVSGPRDPIRGLVLYLRYFYRAHDLLSELSIYVLVALELLFRTHQLRNESYVNGDLIFGLEIFHLGGNTHSFKIH